LRKREERRYLTEKYQQRQVRLANLSRRYQPYDEQRYLRRPLAVRQRFYDLLCGREVGHTWTERERSWKFSNMLGGYDIDPFTRSELGRFRNHSFADCGRPKCPGCSNPRRGYGWWGSASDRLTMQERINDMRMKDDLEYYYNYEEK